MSPQQTWTHWSVRLTLAAMMTLAGCDAVQEPGGVSEPSAPEHATARPTLAEAVVSNPVSAPPAAGPALGGSASGAVVYVSLPPGSVPGAEQVTIRSPRTGALRTVAMVEGGFDPIGMEANAGDTLELDFRVAGADAPLLFAVVVPDSRPPIVVRTDPPPQKRDVPLNAVLLVVFSEPLDAATLTDASVQVLLSGVPVAGALAFGEAEQLTVTFTPAAPLAAGAEYTLRITQEIEDLDGYALGAPVTVEFETRNESSGEPVLVGIYERVSPSSWPDHHSRYVLYDDGAFELQYETDRLSSFAYHGRYSRAESEIRFVFDENPGEWDASGTLPGDSLVVAYNSDMAMSDFEDGVYVRSAQLEPGWASLAPMPEPRWQPGVAAVNDVVYVVGGVADQGAGWVTRSEILAYDPIEDTWRTVGTLPIPVRAPAVAVLDNRIYVVGGFRDNPWEPVADLQIFDPATGTSVAGPPMPTPRGGAAVAVLEDRIHVLGGTTAEFDSVVGEWSNTHEVFDPATGVWSTRAAMPTRRGGHGAASVPAVGIRGVSAGIHVVGGVGDSLAVYDAWTDSWTSYDSPPGRFDAAVVALGGRVYVFGGGEYQAECCGGPIPSATTDRFAAREGSWGQLSPMLTPRTGHRAVTVGGAIYLIGGSSTGAAADALALNERFVPGR